MTLASVADFWGGIADALEAERSPEHAGLPDDWRGWLRSMFPRSVRKPFGPHHEEFWAWLWAIEANVRPRPFIAAWPRGGGKSASAELGVAALGARGRRRYVVYASETQAQADKRVQTIANLLESEAVTAFYPALGRRSTGKHGSPRGWRRNRLWTASGFIVDALGLDTAARGLKVEDQRPDTIVLDDIDGRHDSEKITKKKRTTITESILPMGADDLAVAVLQNLIISTGIVSELVNGTADYLIDREVSGPIPAVYDLETEQETQEDGRVRSVIVGGRPSWEGQDLEVCQRTIDTEGLSAFLRERQHEVDEVEGALWSRDLINEYRVGSAPERLKRIVIGVDPSGGRAEIGIVAVGMGYDGHGYVLKDWSQPGRLGPENWARKVITLYETLKADRIVAEKNFGGDMVEHTLRVSGGGKHVPIYMVTSSRGKKIRAEPAVALYEQGLVHHVGTHPELEIEQTRWIPDEGESPNRLDAVVFALTELFLPAPKTQHFTAPRPPGL